MCTDYLGLSYSQAEQMQINGEHCTKLCLLPILFMEDFVKIFARITCMFNVCSLK